MSYCIGFYEEDRRYGGPEEGGWWYDCGTLARPFRVVKRKDAAYALARRANHLLRFFQDRHRGLRDIGSVIYSGGRYGAHVYENTLPEQYPARRPHYE